MEPSRMGVNLSIKNVPEETLERLKLRARRNHRSLQGELLALIDQAIGVLPPERRPMSLAEVVEQGMRMSRQRGDDAPRWIGEDRNSRYDYRRFCAWRCGLSRMPL